VRHTTPSGFEWPTTPEDGRRARARFGSLDFIVTIRGALERIQAPLPRNDLGTTTEALRGLQLRSQEDDTLPDEQPRGFDSARLER